jgi:hypothetical protein
MSTQRDDQRGSAQLKRELSGRSTRMLEAIEDLRRMEVEKRNRPISTPEFHRLAERITRKSHEIFQSAVDQEGIGDDTSRGEQTIEDINREKQAARE